MKKLVLLTGATGFIGFNVLKELSFKGYYTRIIIRESNASFNFNDSTLLIEKIIQTNDLFLENIDWWKTQLEGVEYIIHTAWYVEPGKYLNSEKNFDCLIGTINLAKAASLSTNLKRVIGLGTCFEYNLNFGLLNVDTPLDPKTAYSISKVSTYLILKEIFSNTNILFVWCRLFYLYGDGEKPNRLYTQLVEKIKNNEKVELTSGNQIRDFLDVKIASKEIVEKIDLEEVKLAYNICSGIPITVKDFAINIATKLNGLDLLQFGVRNENLIDPPVILGVK